MIKNYINLIKSLPVADQAFTIKAVNWQKSLSDSHFQKLFKGEEMISISRRDLRAEGELDIFILKTLLWGYPSGMRGNNWRNIYRRLDDLVNILNVTNIAFLKTEDLSSLQNEFKNIKGLGLSTHSKLLYFRGFKFDGFPALILDERLIRVFKNRVFQDLDLLSGISESNAVKKYFVYLKILSTLSEQYKVAGDQIELFLYTFGNHLKLQK